jgi:hypothetical protein
MVFLFSSHHPVTVSLSRHLALIPITGARSFPVHGWTDCLLADVIPVDSLPVFRRRLIFFSVPPFVLRHYFMTLIFLSSRRMEAIYIAIGRVNLTGN